MKLWRHISLVGLTGAVPLFIVSLNLINASFLEPIKFSVQERRGLAFLRPLDELLILVPRYQEAEDHAAAGDSKGGFSLATVQQQIDQTMAVVAMNYNNRSLGGTLQFTDAGLAAHNHNNARLTEVQTNWNNLKRLTPATTASDDDAGRLEDSIHAMFAQAGDTSNLVLDNELESYYLMDITVNALPHAQQRLGHITLHVGNWLYNGGAKINRSQVAVMAAMLEQDLAHVRRDARVSVRQDKNSSGAGGALQQQIPPAVEKFMAACEPVLQLLDRVAAGETVPAAEFESAGWNAQTESFSLWNTSVQDLDQLLARRIQATQSHRLQFYLIIVGTALAAALLMWLIIRNLLKAYGSEMSKTADVLRAKEAQLRGIGDNLPNGIVYQIMRDFDGTMRFLHISAGVERINGISTEAVLKDSAVYHDQILPEDRAKLLAARQESLANKSVFNIVVRMSRADGCLRWMQFTSMPRRLPDGRFVWDGTATDVTEREQAEEVLAESENRFRTLIEQAPTAVSVSRDGTRLYVNQKYREMFGFQAGDDVLSQPVGTDLTPESRALVEEHFTNRMKGLPAPTIYEVTGVRRDGQQFPMQVVVAKVDLPGGPASIAFLTDISEQKRAEIALKESENRFRILIEQAPTAISISRNGMRIYANRRFLKMFGYDSVEEVAGKRIGGLWAPECRAMIEEYEQRRSQGLPAPAHYEGTLLRKDGSRLPAHVAVTVAELPDGPASIGFMTDISERKRAEVQIQYLNRVYAVLSAINHTIVREKDPQVMVQAACRIAVEKGKFRMAWIGMLEPATQRVKPVAAAGMVDGHPDLLKIDLNDTSYIDGPPAQSVVSGEHAICNDIERDPLNTPWWGEAMRRGYRSAGSFPLKVDGRVVGLFNLYANEPDFFSQQELELLDELAMDISFAMEFRDQEKKRQQAETAVQHFEERFSRMFHNNPLPISLTRLADGMIIDANESFFQMSGYTREEAIGSSVLKLGAYPDPDARTGMVKYLREYGHLHRHEQLFRTKSGNYRSHLLWLELIAIGGEQCILAIAMDVTEQKLLEEQLRQAQKLEALGTLAGGIAHDFNNILGAIISFTELAKMDTGRDAEVQENLGEVLKASRRATNLVQQILAFSRQQKHEYASMQLGTVIKEALKLLRATLPATIEIQQEISSQLPAVLANATQIHQVVMNLCTNAAHAMKNTHGRLTVRLDLAAIKESGTRLHVELKSGDYVRLTVSDTGHGMDPATLKRIFEPFFTTKGPGEGTGLGLAVVHGIIKEHQGVVTVNSAPGKGTTFTIYFPPAPASRPVNDTERVSLTRGNGERVLFVDDEPALGEAAQKMISRLGYQPVVFQSSEEAWEAFRRQPEFFDAIVTDLTMPVMTGMDLARRVLSVSPKIPVIVVTGSSGELANDALQAHGIRELLHKPLDYQTLGAALGKVLNPSSKSQPLSDKIISGS